MAEEERGIVGRNMTNFFTRELFMYSLGDIKFKKPVSLKKMAYTTGFFIVWTLPLFLITGLQLNPYWVAIAILPPLVLGNYATKPVFGGKTLPHFMKAMIGFVKEPKGWTDLVNNNEMGQTNYYVENEIWISRRRELEVLSILKKEEKKARKNRKRQERVK